MLYEKVFKKLEKEKIRYLVIGGIAVNFHGFERPTGDLDILLLLKKDNVENFVRAVKSLGWRPMEHMDIMTENHIDFSKAWRNRTMLNAKKIQIPVISIPDLIRLKKIAGRQRDKIDISALEAIGKLGHAK